MFFLAPRPGHRQASDPVRLAQPEDVPPVTRRQIAAAPLGESRQPAGPHFQRQLGADQVTVPPANQTDAQPVIARLGPLAQEPDRLLLVTCDQIRCPLVVEAPPAPPPATVVL